MFKVISTILLIIASFFLITLGYNDLVNSKEVFTILFGSWMLLGGFGFAKMAYNLTETKELKKSKR